ncbi:MAG: cytidylate kinase-like family protein [Magnetococcales bacterium]|nr:cytidylate kinase-like family protein [Magnetococcales bacterium]
MPIQSIIQSSFLNPLPRDPGKLPLMLTVSGEYGAGGRELARYLASKWQVTFFDPDIIDRIVAESIRNKDLSDQLDRSLPEMLDDWFHALWKKKKDDTSKSVYYLHLVKTVMSIAKTGGVIVGRGAHLILAGQTAVFRLKVEGSRDFCARNISQKEGISLKAAKDLAARMDAERVDFVREIYRRFPTHNTYYDLVLGAESLSREQMGTIVELAMREAGFHIPE